VCRTHTQLSPLADTEVDVWLAGK